jgi:hypothetical protein
MYKGMWSGIALLMIVGALGYLAMTMWTREIHLMGVIVVSCTILVMHHIRRMWIVVVIARIRITKHVTLAVARIHACKFRVYLHKIA